MSPLEVLYLNAALLNERDEGQRKLIWRKEESGPQSMRASGGPERSVFIVLLTPPTSDVSPSYIHIRSSWYSADAPHRQTHKCFV